GPRPGSDAHDFRAAEFLHLAARGGEGKDGRHGNPFPGSARREGRDEYCCRRRRSLDSPRFPGRRSQVVRQRSAKPSSAGSIPAVASISAPANFNFESTVVSHGWYLLAPFRWSRKEQTLRRVEILDKKPREIAI